VRPVTKFADQIVANIAECMLADTATAIKRGNIRPEIAFGHHRQFRFDAP